VGYRTLTTLHSHAQTISSMISEGHMTSMLPNV